MSPIERPRLRFGANYTPSQSWMYSWMDLDLDEVRRDFAGLAELGLDHVRVLPLWPVLQPNRTWVRPQAVDDVRRVVDAAAEHGLDASVDVIQGHLSSFDFVPAWLGSWHRTNMFTDPDAVAGQVLLVERLAAGLVDAPNFLGLTLGNELNQFSGDPHPSPMRADAGQVTRWLEALLGAAEATAPGKEHLHSAYDAVWYLDDHPFAPTHVARAGALTSIHSWVFNGTAQRYGGRSFESDHHAEYLIELSRAFATDPGRPVWLQEVGAPLNCMSADEAPGFLEATVRSAATTENLWGVTWWCSHDVPRRFGDFPELEYSLGLIDSDRRAKPIGRRLAEVAADLRSSPPATPARTVGVVVDVDADDLPDSRGSLGPGGAVFEAWMALAREGAHPALVLSSAVDAGSLAARGIAELVRVPQDGPRAVYQAVNTVVPEAASR
ncbi:cellulase family glycosylhydrolase [Isoptericola hypogeus]|uniref:Cellulase family glycosylhydrolase n=1 Tax=Isoptericola hypogeus TaxID=300179 RepID=A0ABP4V4V2_9MICO